MGQKEGGQKVFLRRFFRSCNILSDSLAGLMTFFVFIIVITQIVGRLLGNPAPWTEELTRYIFIWTIFLGAAIGFRDGESPRITILTNYLPHTLKKGADILFFLAGLGFFIFLFYTGLQLVSQQLNEVSPVLGISAAIVGLCIPVSSCLGILNLIQYFIYSKNN